MKIGLFTATYLDTKLEDVCTMAAELGYQAVELPAFAGNPHLDIDEVVKGSNAQGAAEDDQRTTGLIISALANHPEGQIVLGPYGKDTDAICKGTKEEKIGFGTQRMIKTAQAANALGVPGGVPASSAARTSAASSPGPTPRAGPTWSRSSWSAGAKILDKFGEYGVKFAHEPHPNELVYDVDTALRAVELMGGRKEFGFNFDPANLIYLDIDVENFIDQLQGQIFHVHAKDGEVVEPQREALGTHPAGRLAAAGPRLPLPHPRLGLGALEEGHHGALPDRLRLRHELRARGRDHEPAGRHHQDDRLPQAAPDREALRGPARRAVQLTERKEHHGKDDEGGGVREAQRHHDQAGARSPRSPTTRS